MRIRRYLVSPDLFPSLFRTGLKFEILEGIPDGAQFRGYAIDHATNCLSIFVEHSSFEELEGGLAAPDAEPMKFRRIE